MKDGKLSKAEVAWEQESERLLRAATDNLKRKRYVCPKCGSSCVRQDCDAMFNEAEQRWELAGFYDSFSCDACGSELRKLNEEELP